MTGSAMTEVEAHRISGKQLTHHRCNRYIACFQQKMEMVREQCPPIAGGLGFCDHMAKTLNKAAPVHIIAKNLATLNASTNDIVQGTGCIYAGFSWYDINISHQMIIATQKNNTVPLI